MQVLTRLAGKCCSRVCVDDDVRMQQDTELLETRSMFSPHMFSFQLIGVCRCLLSLLQTDGDAVDPRTDQEEERRRRAH